MPHVSGINEKNLIAAVAEFSTCLRATHRQIRPVPPFISARLSSTIFYILADQILAA
jgi:hypothetical protein